MPEYGAGKKETAKRERGRRETKDEELREAMVGWSHLLLAAHRPSSSRGSPARFRGKEVVGDERAAERGPPEFPR